MESSFFYGSLNKNWKMMEQTGLIECPRHMAGAGLSPPVGLLDSSYSTSVHPPFIQIAYLWQIWMKVFMPFLTRIILYKLKGPFFC